MRLLIGSSLFFSMLASITNAVASNVCTDKVDFQRKLLYSPTQQQIAREENGLIFIYEGITDKEIECILDNYSDRIEYSMFVGIVVTDDMGKPKVGPKGTVTEDDGCD